MSRRVALLFALTCFFVPTAAADDSALVSDVIGAKVSIPADVLISEARAYGHNRDKVSLRGTAPTSASISALKHSLEKLEAVQSANIQFARRQHDKTFMFEIRVEKAGSSVSDRRVPASTRAQQRIHNNALAKLRRIAGANVTPPDAIELTSTVNVGGKSPKTMVYGIAPDNKDIAEFIQQLNATEKFASVDLSSSRNSKRRGQTVKSFRINLVLARQGSGTTGAGGIDNARRSANGKFTYSESQKKTLDDLKEEIETTGSNLAYAMFALQKHKYLHDAGADTAADINSPARWSDPYNLQRLSAQRSSMSLRSATMPNAMMSTNRQDNNGIAVLTGERAVRETLQLGSIGSGPRNNSNARTEPLNSVERLKVPTHPWEKMLAEVEQASVPEIFKLAPRDYFAVYFEDPAKISGLEDAVRELARAGETVTSFSELLSVRKAVAERLGIQHYEKLQPLLAEMVFISEDLSFFPNTHYALIMRFKAEQVSAAADMLLPKNVIRRTISGYTVIATSPRLLDKVSQVSTRRAASLHDAVDFKYMLSTLDQRRHGFAYFSEDFLLKIVSPEHRINAARRNAAVERIETLQYALLAYKSLTGRWPTSWKEMVTTGFIEEADDFSDYPFSSEGFVENRTWGSLYSLKALSDVPIRKVSKEEKVDYDRFRRGYSRFWTRFFDPIALSFLLDDQLYSHLVVKPLINNSEYRQMLEFTGGKAEGFRALKSPHRLVPIQLFMTFDFDNFLLENYRPAAQRLRRRDDSSDEQLAPEQRKQEINARIQQELSLEEPIDVFGMVGDELVLGLGSDIPLALANIADVDFFLGLHLNDPQRFKSFLEMIYAHMATRFQGRTRGPLPFLQLSSTEPMKNTYNNHEYYLIPTGFVNLYYLFHGDHVYFTVSQLAINRLIDSFGKPVQMGAYAAAALDYIGDNHNILFIAELEPIRALREQLIGGAGMRFQRNNSARNLNGYLQDVQKSIEILGGEEHVRRLFPNIPDSALGVEIHLHNNRVVLGGKKVYPLKDVRFPKRYGYQRHNRNDRRMDFFELVAVRNKAAAEKALKSIEGFAAGLSFDEDGLDAKIVVDNPLVESVRQAPEPLPAADVTARAEPTSSEAPADREDKQKKFARKGFGADIAVDRFRRIEALKSQNTRAMIINIALGSLLVVIVLLVIHRKAKPGAASND